MSVKVRLSAQDAGIILGAFRRMRTRYLDHDPADDGQVGQTPTLGWERRGRGLAGEVATRRYLGRPVTVEDLADSYGNGDLTLPNGTIIETRTVRFMPMKLARYDKDAAGRLWVKAVVAPEALDTLASGRGADVWLAGWVPPETCDNRQYWDWRADWRCYLVDPAVLRPMTELLTYVG